MCDACNLQNRRHFLAGSAATIATASMLGSGFLSPAAAKQAPTSLTPDEALARLKEGNAQYVAASELCESELDKRRLEVSEGQAAWATILTCADSRIPPELVFGGLNLGELFVCRNAGSVVDTVTIGTIEYATKMLGSPLVVVLGHQRCGAVTAACEVVEKGMSFPGSIGALVDAIVPVAKTMFGKDGDFVANVVRESARTSAEKILAESEIVRQLVDQGKVKVVYATASLDTGVVEFLG